ncbi:MAG: ribbon-helix-helix protein, CopG family [Candidatus Lokiarchaeota archaeon]|nr:ribbon-helix-helix protein, CopG family [Candidatus Lokiarchaeota archaeon]
MKKQIVTINIPDAYITAFESLIKLGLFNSRSEIVREALKEFLENEKQLNEDLEVDNFYKIKSVQSNQNTSFH